jgi:hypothetical protein
VASARARSKSDAIASASAAARPRAAPSAIRDRNVQTAGGQARKLQPVRPADFELRASAIKWYLGQVDAALVELPYLIYRVRRSNVSACGLHLKADLRGIALHCGEEGERDGRFGIRCMKNPAYCPFESGHIRKVIQGRGWGEVGKEVGEIVTVFNQARAGGEIGFCQRSRQSDLVFRSWAAV